MAYSEKDLMKTNNGFQKHSYQKLDKIALHHTSKRQLYGTTYVVLYPFRVLLLLLWCFDGKNMETN